MKSNITEIIYLLDRSGSMGTMQEPAIAAFNDFLRNQREIPGGVHLTLIQFWSDRETSILARPLQEIEPLTPDGYVPLGNTALLDAIADTITDVDARLKLLPESEVPGKVIFAIFTDGLENASTRHTPNHVSDLIRLYRSCKGWEFIFLAANQDAITSACALQMNRTLSGNVAFSDNGISSSSRALHRKIRSMRLKHHGLMDEQAEADELKPMEAILREEDERGGGPLTGVAPRDLS